MTLLQNLAHMNLLLPLQQAQEQEKFPVKVSLIFLEEKMELQVLLEHCDLTGISYTYR